MNCPQCHSPLTTLDTRCPQCGTAIVWQRSASYNVIGSIFSIVGWLAQLMLDATMLVLNLFVEIINSIF